LLLREKSTASPTSRKNGPKKNPEGALKEPPKNCPEPGIEEAKMYGSAIAAAVMSPFYQNRKTISKAPKKAEKIKHSSF
jgi:hypothetical protein